MAGASLLTLLDDISVILDDVSVMTKIAAKKTAGVFGRLPKAHLLISSSWCQRRYLSVPFTRH